MTPCCGLMGWIFGHKFGSFTVKETPPAFTKVSGSGDAACSGNAACSIFRALTKTESEIRCKRCGTKGPV